MVSSILHLLIIPLVLFGAYLTYSSWKKNQFQNYVSKNLFLFFCFYAVHHIFLSLPVLFSMNITAVAIGYVVAIVFLFLALIPIVMIEAHMIDASKKNLHAVMTLIIALALVVTILQSVQLPEPLIVKGFIFWNADLSMSILTSIVSFLVGMHILFIMAPHWPKHITLRQKIKANLFMAGCSILAFSGLIYFPSHNLIQTIIATTAGYIGMIILVVSLFLKKDAKALGA